MLFKDEGIAAGDLTTDTLSNDFCSHGGMVHVLDATFQLPGTLKTVPEDYRLICSLIGMRARDTCALLTY